MVTAAYNKTLNQSAKHIFIMLCATVSLPLSAQKMGDSNAGVEPTYADLAELSDAAPLVIRAQIRRQAELKPERAPDVASDMVRLYIEAETVALLVGSVPVGESLTYLVDLPRTERGRAPKLKKQEVLLFAKPVPGSPRQLQLVDPSAQLPWSAELEARLRPILTDLVAPNAPPRIVEIRDALSVPGNLVGESETQIFLETADNSPASLTITRRPGMAPRWGVSFTELVDQSARPPEPNSLAWFRLACSLPATLPPGVNLSRDAESRSIAEADYSLVMQDMGPCERNR